MSGAANTGDTAIEKNAMQLWQDLDCVTHFSRKCCYCFWVGKDLVLGSASAVDNTGLGVELLRRHDELVGRLKQLKTLPEATKTVVRHETVSDTRQQ